MRYPVHYDVERPVRLARVPLAARLIAFDDYPPFSFQESAPDRLGVPS